MSMDPFEVYEARIKELEEKNTKLTEKVEDLRGFITRMRTRICERRAPAMELLAACQLALEYFNETRSGREWRDNGGEEPGVLRDAINKAEGMSAIVKGALEPD